MRINKVGATYLSIAAILVAFIVLLVATVRTAAPVHGAQADLIQPIVWLVFLTFVAAVMMGLYRNVSVVRGAVSARYFKAFTDDRPAEWIERPARAYMNLLELPVLFYLVCLLMLITGSFDSAQISLAWLFVATRYVHAVIYIGFNHVPSRFAAFLTGVITLAVIWVRFAQQNLS